MFVVVFHRPGEMQGYFLRGTIWTGEMSRASQYATVNEARDAITKAKAFNPRAAKLARIRNLSGEVSA